MIEIQTVSQNLDILSLSLCNIGEWRLKLRSTVKHATPSWLGFTPKVTTLVPHKLTFETPDSSQRILCSSSSNKLLVKWALHSLETHVSHLTNHQNTDFLIRVNNQKYQLRCDPASSVKNCFSLMETPFRHLRRISNRLMASSQCSAFSQALIAAL